MINYEFQDNIKEQRELNVDGAAVASSNLSFGGGVLRDDKEDLIWGFCKRYGHHSSLFAETKALLDGLKFCCASKFSFILVKTDSKRMVETEKLLGISKE